VNNREIIETLKSEEDEALFTQVEQFIQEMEKDQKEVQMKGLFNLVQTTLCVGVDSLSQGIDITNPTAVVDLLTR